MTDGRLLVTLKTTMNVLQKCGQSFEVKQVQQKINKASIACENLLRQGGSYLQILQRGLV